MLEIRNVTKVYRSKTGDSVKALDDVSLSFPESGMIFILGKSGSGKSTLLNVMGGLDSYDSGEFIIKGRSSKSFSGSDFDAYRNTFIGFIFQEYNVLDDFTVGANIALALELQGKKATDAAINQILQQVDLTQHARRKPNELSGGQKQRVAIARALVKEPQIIMADEPTGALDSNTGKQIFDTLKALSREKLVLVVSHDRDFAERYADRIIEMADGKVVEDVTKHEHHATRLSDGVHRINQNIFRIERGYRLTAEDLEMINSYLAESGGDVLLSGDGRVNDELRSAVGITKDGASTSFEVTSPEEDVKLLSYTKEQSKFIRSRLPMKNAVKIGASGLKHKKFRLFMTIMLSFLAFTMFGLSFCMAAYEKFSAANQSIIDSNINYAAMTLDIRYSYTYDGEEPDYYYGPEGLNDQDIAFLREQTGLDFLPVFTGSSYHYYSGIDLTRMMDETADNQVYSGSISGLLSMSEEQVRNAGFELYGSMPQNKSEIVITEFLYRQLNFYGYKNDLNGDSVEKGKLTLDDNTETGIIGRELNFYDFGNLMMNGVRSYKIVGVVDTYFDYSRYESLLPTDDGTEMFSDFSVVDIILSEEVSRERDYGFHALGFVTDEDIQELASYMHVPVEIGEYMSWGNAGMELRVYIDYGDEENENLMQIDSCYRVAGSEEIAMLNDITWLESGKTTLGENEILIPKRILMNAMTYDGVLQSVSAEEIDQHLAEVYGESWSRSKTLKCSNLYECITRCEAVLYAEEQLKDPAVLAAVDYDRQMDESVDAGTSNAEYWAIRLVNDGYKPPVEGKTFLNNVEDIYVRMAEREGIRSLIEKMYGIADIPEYLDSFAMKGFLEPLYQIDVRKDAQVEITVNRDNVTIAVRRMLLCAEIEKNELWKNTALVDELLTSDFADGYGIRKEDWASMSDEAKKVCVSEYLMSGYSSYVDVEEDTDKIGRDAFQTAIGSGLADIANKLSFEVLDTMTNSTLSNPSYRVVGYFENDYLRELVISDDLMAQWSEHRDTYGEALDYTEERAAHMPGIWAFCIAPLADVDEAVLEKLVEMSYAPEGTELIYSLQNPVMYMLEQFNEIIEVLAIVFVWIGVVFAVFASFLLMNFIATSISYKKREIGILRAVGARSSDVFKIFFSEAFIIALINFLLSATVTGVTIFILNFVMRSAGLNITLLTFGPLQLLLMLAISLAVAVIASFLPVWRIARKKPVDAIKNT